MVQLPGIFSGACFWPDFGDCRSAVTVLAGFRLLPERVDGTGRIPATVGALRWYWPYGNQDCYGPMAIATLSTRSYGISINLMKWISLVYIVEHLS